MRRRLAVATLVLTLCCRAGAALADPTYQPVPFSQDWSNTGLITINDDWSAVPGVLAYRGDGLTEVTGVDPQTVTGDDFPGVIDVNANQVNPNTLTLGGVAEFEIADPCVALQGSGTADAPYLVLHVDASSNAGVNVSYRLRDVDGSSDNAVSPVALQYRTGESDDWTNVPSAFVPDVTTGPGSLGPDSLVSATLPANFSPTLQIRFITTNAFGNDEWIAVDDILVVGVELTTYSLDIAVVGSGAVTKDPDQSQYVDGTVVELTAVPDPGWGFIAWSGDVSGSSNPTYVTMDEDKSVTGTFGAATYALDVTIVGSGSVARSPDQSSYEAGTIVQLAATPEYGWEFVGWSGDASGASNPTFVTMNDDMNVTATFAALPYPPLPLFQDWSNTGLITMDDDWSGVPGIIGYRGDLPGSMTGVDPRTLTANDTAPVIDVNANRTALLGTPAGVAEFHQADPSVALAGDGTADAPYLVVHVDATGKSDITVSCRLRDLEIGGMNDAISQVALQFRTDDSSSWTNVPESYVSDASWPPFGFTTDTPLYAVLPPAADGAATLQIRVITTNAAGNDEWIGIDDILVTEGAPFVEVTVGPPLNPANFGAVWGDYDGDDDPDLFISNYATALWSKLLRNDGGSFSDVTTPAIAGTEDVSCASAAWGDSDNDGDVDLCVGTLSSADSNRFLRNDDAGAFTTFSIPGRSSYSVAWGDYDSDGLIDLYMANYGGANQLLHNDGGGVFSDVTSGPLGDTEDGLGTMWGDYDDDGDLDIYLVNESAPDKLFRNDGGGVFVDATSPLLAAASDSAGGAAWGDYDNDGDLDLYVSSGSDESKLFRNDGGGTFADLTTAALAGAGVPCLNGVAWIDYDLDKDLDLFVTGGSSGGPTDRPYPSILIRNDGGGAFTRVGGIAVNARVAVGQAWADYDGDGDLDLYVANLAGPNSLFRNEQTSGNHWLHVKLVGNPSNRSGIGARVRVVAGGVSQSREISGSACMGAQNSLTAEFGLGAATIIDSLIIRWPSGLVQSLSTPPAVDQVITIMEGVDTDVPFTPPADAGLWLAVSPNPTNDLATVRFGLPRQDHVRLELFDVSGRRIATLVDGVLDAGAHHVPLSTGSLPPGVYVYRARAGADIATRKLFVVR